MRGEVTERVRVYYLNATLTCPVYLVVVVIGATWTGAGALPQEVKRAPITRSCRTGAASTENVTSLFWPVINNSDNFVPIFDGPN